MFKTKPYCSAAAAALVVCATGHAGAAILEATANDNSAQTFFDGNISTTDLINNGSASLGTFTASKNANFSTDGLHDGNAVGNSGLAYWGSGDDQGGGVRSITLTYTLVGSATGYDIESINSIHGWGDSAERHLAQRYDVKITTIANASFQNLYSVTYDPFTGSHGGATQVTLTNDAGGALDNGSGVVATGVTGIQFVLYNDPGGSEVGVVREYDVIGQATIPEPGSLALMAIGGLLIARRRRD